MRTRLTWPPSPYLMLLIGVMAVSTASLFIRYAQAAAMPSLVIAALRMGFAALILTPFALQRGRATPTALSRRDLGLILLSGVMLAIHFATWITSLEHVSVLVSVVLVTTNPLWVALMAPLLLKEPLTRRTLAGIGMAFIGGVLISLADGGSTSGIGSNPLLGSLLAVAGAIAAALYLIIGRKMRATLPLLTYIWLVYGIAALCLLGATVFTGQALTGYSPGAYGWALALALIPQLLGHTSFNYALGHVTAAYVSLVILAEPIGSALLALIFLGEIPVWLQLIGAGLILFAVAFARQEEGSPAPQEQPAQA